MRARIGAVPAGGRPARAERREGGRTGAIGSALALCGCVLAGLALSMSATLARHDRDTTAASTVPDTSSPLGLGRSTAPGTLASRALGAAFGGPAADPAADPNAGTGAAPAAPAPQASGTPTPSAAPAAVAAPGKDAPDPFAVGQISGSVLTPARQPVKGASVAVLHEGGVDVYGTSTGEDGRYALKALRTGAYSVLVMDPGGSILRKDRVIARALFRNLVDFVTAPAGAARPHLPSAPSGGGEAPPTFDLSGLVVAADGRAIPEAWVWVAPMSTEAPSLRARTDAGGRFRLLRVPTGYYRITARSLGQVTWSLGPLLFGDPGERSLRLTLLPYPLGHPQTPEELIMPIDPVPPEAFAKEPPS